jgi:Tol biopolymer transport system component
MLAYTSGEPRKIFVRNLGGGEGVKVTSDTYDDVSPSWSSDGARLAYVAAKPGEPCHIMVVTVPAGAAREAGRCATAEMSSLSWQPGTSLIYFAEQTGLKGDAIFQLDLDSGARRKIVQESATRDLISSLHCSPDGKWLAYLLRGQSIIIRDLSSGKEQMLGAVPGRVYLNNALAWSEDSKAVLASVSTGMGGEITVYPLSGQVPYRLYTTAMHIGRLAAGSGLLALETDTSRVNLARAGINSGTEPDVIDPANGMTWSPTFAPDGTLAFLSNRSGTNAIWIMRPGGAAQQLFDGGFSPLYRVRFSPDGSRLAVVTETPEKVTIRVMSTNGASLTSFDMPSLGLGLPSWTPDGKALLVFDRKSLRTISVAIDNPAQRSPFAPPHWVGIAVRPDGTFATRVDKPGIWRIDGNIALVNNIYPAFYEPPLAFQGGDVLVPEFSTEGTPRILAQPVAGGKATLAGYAPGAASEGDFQTAFAVNPKTGEIFYTARVARDTNIDLLTLAKH